MKGQTHVLVDIVAVLIVGAILFLFTQQSSAIMQKVGINQVRSLAPFMNAYFRDPLMRIEQLKIEFPFDTSYFHTDGKTLFINDERRDISEQEIKLANDMKYFEPPLEYKHIDKEENKGLVYSYVVDAQVAEELERCWHDVGEGKLPLFSEWWKRTKAGGNFWAADSSSAPSDTAWIKYSTAQGMKSHPPVFCIICARIEVDEAMANIMPVASEKLNTYLRGKESRYGADIGDEDRQSIASYAREQTESGLFLREHFYYPGAPFAVVFARMNTLQSQQMREFATDTLGITRSEDNGDDFNAMFIIPYEGIDEVCTFLANS
ncbi:MAG: hypothetical protein V1735_03675 [Nanoarchaeota archaeon]